MHRYTKLKVINDRTNGKQFYKKVKYPYIPPQAGDLYAVTRGGDRLDLLAHQFYKDKRLWWIIATANPDVIRRDSFYLEPGLSLRIPNNILPIIDSFEKANK